jgi:2-dehydro-3-deoxyphosphogluconate aldolase / (4S)-4-hydroxy-2-oxoglutarate aldolase
MSKKEENLQQMMQGGVVAIIRAESSDGLLKVVEAIGQGGITAVEITMTTPNALAMISEVAVKYRGSVLIGVGTVLDSETARLAILAGAEFVVSPHLNMDVIKTVKRYSKIVIPGAFTPTEIITAWESGADIVKVFPTSSVGPEYIRDLKGPLPQILMMPTGGVTFQNATAFIKAGAAALAVGGNLASKKAIAEGRYQEITENAKKFVHIVKDARNI